MQQQMDDNTGPAGQNDPEGTPQNPKGTPEGGGRNVDVEHVGRLHQQARGAAPVPVVAHRQRPRLHQRVQRIHRRVQEQRLIT